ncbi:hypothetical protein GOV13_02630 [Candidatus Pacearchaeota archaeon]|nr:hypothetical protein [Candidatus Pacearchaeota archaeon]
MKMVLLIGLFILSGCLQEDYNTQTVYATSQEMCQKIEQNVMSDFCVMTETDCDSLRLESTSSFNLQEKQCVITIPKELFE